MIEKTWAENIRTLIASSEAPSLPEGISNLNPFKQSATMAIVELFLKKFFNDNNERTLLFGINPGRFGAGLTGISFTDPIRLKDDLGIDHSFQMRGELSSEFINEIIKAYGGAESFYSHYFISSIFPLCLISQDKNINYYDLKHWEKWLMPAIEIHIAKHLQFNVNRNRVYSIGMGKNHEVLYKINHQFGWFDEVIALPHPRWVMQYRRKRKMEFIAEYLKLLSF